MKITFAGQLKFSNYAFGVPTKQKQRSRLGMVGHDAKQGAKIGAGLGALGVASAGVRGVMKAPGGIKSKLSSAALVGATGLVAGGLSGGLAGTSIGAQTGAARALLTPRKKKGLLDRFKK